MQFKYQIVVLNRRMHLFCIDLGARWCVCALTIQLSNHWIDKQKSFILSKCYVIYLPAHFFFFFFCFACFIRILLRHVYLFIDRQHRPIHLLKCPFYPFHLQYVCLDGFYFAIVSVTFKLSNSLHFYYCPMQNNHLNWYEQRSIKKTWIFIR